MAAIGATFGVMGLTVSAYGPLLEHLTRRFEVSLPVAGATISIHFAGTLLGVLGAMWAMQKLPARIPVVVALLLAGAGCAGIALAPAWPCFVGAVCVVGVGFGVLLIALNQLVAYSGSPRRAALLNGLNAAYSAGAVAGPILVATFASRYFSALYIGVAVVALVLVLGAGGISGRLPVGVGAAGRPGRLVLIFVMAFMLYVAIENGTGGWMASHLESVGLRSGAAAAVTSGFWLALMTGRLLMTLVPASISERSIVIGGSAVAAATLLAATAGVAAPIAYVVTGFALAPIFPTGVVWLAKLRPGDARSTSWVYPAASIGGIAGPGAIGLVIGGFGVRWAPAVLGLVAIAMSASFWLAQRSARAR